MADGILKLEQKEKQIENGHDMVTLASTAPAGATSWRHTPSHKRNRMSELGWRREGESNPQGAKNRRILSSTVRSEPLGKFSTLLYFSTGYQICELSRFDPR